MMAITSGAIIGRGVAQQSSRPFSLQSDGTFIVRVAKTGCH